MGAVRPILVSAESDVASAFPAEPPALKEQLHSHLQRIEEGLFHAMEAALQAGESPNASLARELRQYIHDILDTLERRDEREDDLPEITLDQLRRAYAEVRRRQSDEDDRH